MNTSQKGSALVIVLGVAVIIIAVAAIIMSGALNLGKSGEVANFDQPANETEGTMMQSETKPEATSSSMTSEETGAMQPKQGTYESYAPEKLSLASNGKVVLFFHASWCPICRAIESEILRDPTKLPQNVHILKVNYDNEISLRQKYGVTTQHTFVQVDAQGNQIAKWSTATTLAATLGNIK